MECSGHYDRDREASKQASNSRIWVWCDAEQEVVRWNDSSEEQLEDLIISSLARSLSHIIIIIIRARPEPEPEPAQQKSSSCVLYVL